MSLLLFCGGVFRRVFGWLLWDNLGVARGFKSVDRDQPFLLPPDMRQWLPGDHFVWFLIDVVGELDLSGFMRGYRLGAKGNTVKLVF